MHTTIDYSGLTGRAKREKALADCKSWLGEAKFKSVMKSLELSQECGGPTAHREYLQFVLSLGGIAGYPAQAMIDEAHGWPYDDK
jgi:hypothetical protein